MTEEVYAHAESLLFRSPLRGLDALHLACAIIVAARLPHIGLEFWTAGKQQAQAAQAGGFTDELSPEGDDTRFCINAWTGLPRW